MGRNQGLFKCALVYRIAHQEVVSVTRRAREDGVCRIAIVACARKRYDPMNVYRSESLEFGGF